MGCEGERNNHPANIPILAWFLTSSYDECSPRVSSKSSTEHIPTWLSHEQIMDVILYFLADFSDLLDFKLSNETLLLGLLGSSENHD